MDSILNKWLAKSTKSSPKRQVNHVKKRHYFNETKNAKCPTRTDSDDAATFKSKKEITKSPKKGLTSCKILSEQKDLEAYKAKVAEVQAMLDVPLKEPVFPKPPPKNEVLNLDCKHLTLNQITQYFYSHKQFLKDIIEGKEFSDRHKKYHRVVTMNSLTYNTSTIVFSFEQIDHIATLMGREFDPEDQKTDYFFKVLVPEFCFKLFMDIHNMSKCEATLYLDKRPVD